MKIKYILCVLVLMLFIVGCAKQQEVAPQPAAAEKPSTPDVNELKVNSRLHSFQKESSRTQRFLKILKNRLSLVALKELLEK